MLATATAPPLLTPTTKQTPKTLSESEWSGLRQLQAKVTELFEADVLTGNPLDGEQEWGTSDETAWRFMKANRFDVDRAFEGLKRTLQWRREYRPTEITPSEIEEESKNGKAFWSGFDTKGRPIFHIQASKLKSSDWTRYLKYLVFNLEHGVDLCPGGDGAFREVAVVVESNGFSAFSPPIFVSMRRPYVAHLAVVVSSVANGWPACTGKAVFLEFKGETETYEQGES
ncbi:hypothetical protein HDU98_003762 [Podochytrium sp. JEL0797]|nr:hypothetical protein HDU98_003762 [Podochytrium sp. JEL0797]